MKKQLANLIRVSLAYDAADRLVRLANMNSTGTTLTSFRRTSQATETTEHTENDEFREQVAVGAPDEAFPTVASVFSVAIQSSQRTEPRTPGS